MAIVEQLIRSESDDTLSFGNYQLSEKAKVENVKIYRKILKKQGFFLFTKNGVM